MAVTRLEMRSRQPYEGGLAFGEVGPYERLDGTIHFAVDPTDPANQLICDLDKAEQDAHGRVEFWADFCLLQPVDPGRANRRLLFDVVNRGRKRSPRFFNRSPDVVGAERIDPGDGFLMRRGWTLAWCGWQWDVIRSPALMGLEAPTALEGGQPIQGRVVCRFQPNQPTADHLLADRIHRPYPAADLDEPDAVMTVREWPNAPADTIPRERWRFARDDSGRLGPSDSHVWLAGGFAPGRVYELAYRTRVCPVVGVGLLAVRDCVAFLRYGRGEDGNPCAGRLDRSYGFGVSQSGRFLRHFLYLGLNLDEQRRQVFDGVIAHVAGARRGEFNHRFAQPSVQATPGFGHLMPFAEDEQTDPLTGQTDGLLRRQRALGGLPKVFMTNTSAEYWRADCSLAHTDLRGEYDVEPPAEVRNYHFAGTQHGPGSLPLTDTNQVDGSRGANRFNAVDYSPLIRAALDNLDRWVTSSEQPPPSAFPRLADGTAVPAASVLEAYRSIPGAAVPSPERLPSMPRVDLGPDATRGIGRFPVKLGGPYPTCVSAVDADGNELASIRLPDLTVPVATYTGWNPRHPESGSPGQIIQMQGSTLPFAPTARERKRNGDPRPSIAERYRDRDDYLARVRLAAERLVSQRYLLAQDVELVVALAAERYDAFAQAPVEVRV